jgi:hypothetical protein
VYEILKKKSRSCACGVYSKKNSLRFENMQKIERFESHYVYKDLLYFHVDLDEANWCTDRNAYFLHNLALHNCLNCMNLNC